ncbi:MAG: hypothetical protein DRO10_01785 [Thermoprotei archaeon]|nr:MAG: hypothetical protein DRO10_01785 [Thermoprotei archaeon]
MASLMFSAEGFVLLITGLTALLGVLVYLIFYELFQRYGGRPVEEKEDELKYYPVVSGWEVKEVQTPPISYVIVDILSRAWRGVSRTLSRSSEAFLRDWYVYAYLLLVVIVAVTLVLRWWP